MLKFVLFILLAMLLLDIGWWIVVRRIVRGKIWRGILQIFVAVQILGLVAFVAARIWRVQWLHQMPKTIFASVVTWHFFGLAMILVIGLIAGSVAGAKALAKRHKQNPAAARHSEPEKSSLTRREFVATGIAAAPALFSIGLTGVAMAQLSQFRVRRFTVQIPSLPSDLEGVTIAHVSDIHVGRLTNGKVLKEIARVTNELRSDLVLLTGDLINDALSDLPDAIAVVNAMESRFGSWMIQGNHDVIESGDEFNRQVKAAGIRLLLDESAVTNIRGHPVQLFGLRWPVENGRRRDYTASLAVKEMVKSRQNDAFPILLAHHPHAFDSGEAAGFPLVLAGHTHGGQLMLNRQHGFGPAFFRYWSGLYRRGNSQMIVSNGVGNWFPVRINAPAEIVHVTLVRGHAA